MTEVNISETHFAPMELLLNEWLQRLGHRYDKRPRQFEQPPAVIKNYFDNLFQGGDVVFLYARPRTGATALFLKLLLEFSESARPVLYASSRADPMNFMTRLITSATGIPLTRLVDGQLFTNDWCILTKCAACLFKSHIYYVDHYEMDPSEISQKMRLWCYQQNDHRGLLLFDDYADHSLADPGDFERNIAGLKFLAQKTNTLLVVLVKLGYVSFPDYDLDRLFTVEEWPGEQFVKRVVMKNDETGVILRMLSSRRQSGHTLRLGYNRQTDSLEYLL